MTDNDKRTSPLNREQSDLIRARQKSRAKALGIVLFVLAALFYAITIVKTGVS